VTSEIGGAGSLGVAFETSRGTYVAPTKWMPIRSESLQLMEDKYYRMSIRGLAEKSGAIPGYTHTEGDVEMDITSDTLVYWMYATRNTPAKSGAGPYTYTFTPAHVAKTTTASGASTRKTLSIHVERGGNPRGFVGCAVSQYSITVDAGVLIGTFSIVGDDEASQSNGTESWPTSVPFGPGKVSLEIPTSTPRADADTFTFTVNDNLAAANRLNGSRAAAYNNWGEREVTLSVEVDFDTVADFNIFKAGTFQTAKVIGSNNASNDEVTWTLSAAVMDSYVYNLAGLGEVNRATIEMQGIYNGSDSVTTVIKTTENVT